MVISMNLASSLDDKVEFYYNFEKKCISIDIVLETGHGSFDTQIDIKDLDQFKQHLDYLFLQGSQNG